jgi:hypothetical protein
MQANILIEEKIVRYIRINLGLMSPKFKILNNKVNMLDNRLIS